jgi:hypothetical protein
MGRSSPFSRLRAVTWRHQLQTLAMRPVAAGTGV